MSKVPTNKEPQFHDNGTVTYWSEMQQCWVRRTGIVPEGELAGMPEATREKIQKHLLGLWTPEE